MFKDSRSKMIKGNKVVNTRGLSLVIFCFILLPLPGLLYAKNNQRIVQDLSRGTQDSQATTQVFGKVEEILVFEEQVKFEAKLDTGAKISSLSAINIKEFEIDEQIWVAFQIIESQSQKLVDKEFPLARHAYIKQHQKGSKIAKSAKRPVVMLPVCVGNQFRIIEVNLVNRKHFKYPVLLGRDAIIQLNGVVDPNKEFTAVPSCEVAL